MCRNLYLTSFNARREPTCLHWTSHLSHNSWSVQEFKIEYLRENLASQTCSCSRTDGRIPKPVFKLRTTDPGPVSKSRTTTSGRWERSITLLLRMQMSFATNGFCIPGVVTSPRTLFERESLFCLAHVSSFFRWQKSECRYQVCCGLT